MNEEKMNSKIGIEQVCEHQNSILRTRNGIFVFIKNVNCCSANAPCSHGVRRNKEKGAAISRNPLIFNVDQPGLEPGTSRL